MSVNKQLFCCSSYYQVLISLMKACVDNQKIDLWLEVHGIETAGELSVSICNHMSDYVEKVFVCPNDSEVDPYIMRNASFVPKQKKRIIKAVESIFGSKEFAKDYSQINVYWDLGYAGTYLNIKKINYKLIEDSLDSYKKIKANRPNYRYIFDNPLKLKLKQIFGIGVVPFGYSRYAQIVEVNDKADIEIPLDKVTELNRQYLFDRLTGEHKKKIFDSFMADVPLNISESENSILILTEPFAITNRLPSREIQIQLYKDIIKEFGDGIIFIKPHPRDDTDYTKYIDNIVLLEKNIPMEVLNFSDDFGVRKSITVTSSAINGITCDKEKIYLGPEYLAKYKEKK